MRIDIQVLNAQRVKPTHGQWLQYLPRTRLVGGVKRLYANDVQLIEPASSSLYEGMKWVRLHFMDKQKGFGFMVDRRGNKYFFDRNCLNDSNIHAKSLGSRDTFYISYAPAVEKDKKPVIQSIKQNRPK